jgi:exosortase A
VAEAALHLPHRRWAVPVPWRKPLVLLAVGWTVLIVLFASDWAAMAQQWWDVSTYSHILLIPPIIVWLMRLRWPQLQLLQPMAWWPGLLPLAGALLLWLLGDLAGLNLASQTGAVAMLPALALALLGPRVALGLLFPLAYMAFLVPFGDELIPLLQTITARLTIALTHWSGVDARIEGVFIDTPVGLFEVAEACSGVKFLIAMVALGALVAHVSFRSWRRRALFMGTAVVIPVLANGVRAWGTIYIAQSHGVAFASGFDHVFYGWIFFAVVIALLLAAGWRFFDRPAHDRFIDAAALQADPLLQALTRRPAHAPALLAAALLLALGTAGWSRAAEAVTAPVPAVIDLPRVPGWQRADYTPVIAWYPLAAGANYKLIGRYRDEQGHHVDVFVALYAAQGEGREAGAFGQGALVEHTPWRWLEPAPAVAGGQGEWLQALGVHRRMAVTFYRSGSLLTGSNIRLKLATLQSRLLMQPRATTVLIVSAEEQGGAAAPAIRSFIRSAAPLAGWMDRIASVT